MGSSKVNGAGNGSEDSMGSFKKAEEPKGSIFCVLRIVHFVGGSAVSAPISFHPTGEEAARAKDAESAQVKRIYQSDKRFDMFMQRLGIAAVQFEVGEFKTEHANLIEVPRLIMSAH